MTTTSRRSFLKLGLAATAGGVGLAQAKPVFEPASFDKETDVVICCRLVSGRTLFAARPQGHRA